MCAQLYFLYALLYTGSTAQHAISVSHILGAPQGSILGPLLIVSFNRHILPGWAHPPLWHQLPFICSCEYIFRFPVLSHNLQTLRDISTWLFAHLTLSGKLTTIHSSDVYSNFFMDIFSDPDPDTHVVIWFHSVSPTRLIIQQSASWTLEMVLKDVEEHKISRINVIFPLR